MYSFTDSMNGDHLSLRPEGTAGTVRAVLEHNLAYEGPKRLWYKGPDVSPERPAARAVTVSLFQFGARKRSVFTGLADVVPAELIMLVQVRLWIDLGPGKTSASNSIRSAMPTDACTRHRAT